ncbi:thiamine phosphate synthase [Corallincola holothuriorum]|uniref:Thiamine-phosphate synthase n=1 Tax=Corallincola holothuriorum TaxID=2282215 RepID=A0A368NLP4_9GAMM|nr:thiamine phosphate synthase [Corallincola holothuriorum]RCU50813.1 thiamine phosphate synthase [Corallincola holothuriorum]
MITPYTCGGELVASGGEGQVSAIVWAIGGSDCSAGAGIQADLQAINGLGAHGCTVITAVTAQNSVAVSQVNPVSDLVLQSQLDVLLADLPPRIIKIGLLATVSQVVMVSQWLQQLKQTSAQTGHRVPLVVYDPVAVASSGDNLVTESTLTAVTKHLLPWIDLLTPNAMEAALLAGMALQDGVLPEPVIKQLLALGVGSVLLKGGHYQLLADHCLDYWSNGDSQRYLSAPRLDTAHGHGTGCSLASAIAAIWAQGYALEDALVFARGYLQQGLAAAVSVGAGAGPVKHLGWPTDSVMLPRVGASLAELTASDELVSPVPFAPCPQRLGLYPVVDSVAWLARLLAAGVKTLQLRIKDPQSPDLRQKIAAAVALGHQYQARLFINDHWQLAIELGAYGVHLGQEDLQTADLAAIKRAGLRLGISTHGIYELLRAAQLRPSYLALGHIFATQTKQMPSQPQGLFRLAQQVQLLPNTPLVAIGGIDAERASAVMNTGVGSFAVVSAITKATAAESMIAKLQHIAGDPVAVTEINRMTGACL